MKNLKIYEVGVEVIENPSKEPNKITYTTYEVEAATEYEASRKASDLCSKEFMQLPYAIEMPYVISENNRIFKELTKAQSECIKADEHNLFDLCEYHIDYIMQNELSKSHELVILKFAKDVFKIAKLKNNLDSLI